MQKHTVHFCSRPKSFHWLCFFCFFFRQCRGDKTCISGQSWFIFTGMFLIVRVKLQLRVYFMVIKQSSWLRVQQQNQHELLNCQQAKKPPVLFELQTLEKKKRKQQLSLYRTHWKNNTELQIEPNSCLPVYFWLWLSLAWFMDTYSCWFWIERWSTTPHQDIYQTSMPWQAHFDLQLCTIGEDLSGANRAKIMFISFPTTAHRAVNNLDAAVRDHVGESIFLFGLDGLFMQYLLAESLDFLTCGERP